MTSFQRVEKRRTTPPGSIDGSAKRQWWQWGRPERSFEIELKEQSEETRSFLSRCDTMQTLRMLQSEEPSLLAQAETSQGSDSVGSLSSVEDDTEPTVQAERLFSEKQEPYSKTAKSEIDVDAYMAEREMTPTQERWNALTVVPNPLFCIYFLVAGHWLSEALVEEARTASLGGQGGGDRVLGTLGTPFNALLADENGCVHSTWFSNLYALPPLPLVMVAVGITIHAPFSFLYHWKYAHALPSGRARTEHWSRRLDQSMIHTTSACLSYATSGSWDFFLANLMFNLDCVYRQFKHQVHPKRNQIRIAISILAYTIPLVKRGDLALFCQLWGVFLVSFYIFAKYPFGGWSHSVFHIVATLIPPLLMMAACELPASQGQMRVAAQCAVMAGS